MGAYTTNCKRNKNKLWRFLKMPGANVTCFEKFNEKLTKFELSFPNMTRCDEFTPKSDALKSFWFKQI